MCYDETTDDCNSINDGNLRQIALICISFGRFRLKSTWNKKPPELHSACIPTWQLRLLFHASLIVHEFIFFLVISCRAEKNQSKKLHKTHILICIKGNLIMCARCFYFFLFCWMRQSKARVFLTSVLYIIKFQPRK